MHTPGFTALGTALMAGSVVSQVSHGAVSNAMLPGYMKANI